MDLEKRELADPIASLLEDETARGRSSLYLRLLYSDSVAQGLVGNAGGSQHTWLRTVDFRKLAIERRARHGNLANRIRDNAAGLASIFTTDQWTQLAGWACDAPVFWGLQGRSLVESFALAVIPRFAHDPLLRDIVRLYGVVSGIGVNPEKPTPWSDHSEHKGETGLFSESFESAHRLLAEGGQLPSAHNISALRELAVRPWRVQVTTASRGNVDVECVPHGS